MQTLFAKLRRVWPYRSIHVDELDALRAQVRRQADALKSAARSSDALAIANRTLRTDMLQAAQDVSKLALNLSGDERQKMQAVVARLDKGARQ